MTEYDIDRLEKFLRTRFGFKIPKDLNFKMMTGKQLDFWLNKTDTIKGKIVNLSMNDFLNNEFFFNSDLEKVVSETIIKNNLKIYTGIVSYDGRDQAALTTGSNTFENLKNLEHQGLIKRFLTYQGDRNSPSPLCRYALDERIKVYFVDEVFITDKNNKILLDKKVRGKTENILKFLLMIADEIKKEHMDPKKIFILFLDDDYTLIDERAHYILLATWVLSFVDPKRTDVQKLITRCKGAGFVKNGGVRIHFPPYLTHKILHGEVIKNYRSLLIEAIKLDIEIGVASAEASKNILKGLIRKLQRLPCNLMLTPENLPFLISHTELYIIRKIMKKFFYAGGRVTKPFTRKNVHESENYLSYWLGLFTFILHGDQGTSLHNWNLLNLGQGYAFDSSVIIQFLLDENFSNQRVVDIRNTPHAHQPQEQPQVEGMEDLINLVTEALRVYYGNWDLDSFILRYKKRTRVSWRADGSYLRLKIKPEKGVLFYPPAGKLRLNFHL